VFNAVPYISQALYQSGSYHGYPPNEQVSNQGYQAILFHMRKIRYTRFQITRATLLQTRKVHIRDTFQTRNKLFLMVRAYYLAPSGTTGGATPVVGPQYYLPHLASFTVVKHLLSLSEGDWMINDAA